MTRSANCLFRPALLACVLACALGAPPAGAQIVSPLDYAVASVGDVRLGVALAAVSELADTPSLLDRPSSQAFVDDVFARVLASTNDTAVRAHVDSVRAGLRVEAAAPFDRARAEATLATFTREVLRALPAARNRLCIVGILAQSTSFNARVLRSPSVDADLRKALGATVAADALIPGLPAMRAELAAIRRGRWVAIAASADKIVAAIVGNATVPFPESGGVWVVLLRSSSVEGMRARRGVPHLWFDIVRFDGTHRTIGAYPDDGDFAHDAQRMACGIDREAANESERAVPLAPPPGTTTAQLADALVARCAADERATGTYRPRDANDARYAIDAMLAVGIDAAAVMRAAR